jgi:hypothetical protein
MSVTRWGPPRPPRGTDADAVFLRYWVFWVSLGQVVGVLAPAVALLVLGGTPLRAPAVIAAGAVQGAVVGWTQATVLRVRVPALNRRRWVRATAIGAAMAWFIALLPAEWAEVWQRWPADAQLIAAIVGVVVVLVTPGTVQWAELRRHSRFAAWWIPGGVSAGGVGLVVFVAVVSPLWRPDQPVALTVLIGVLGGVLLMLSIALVCGAILLRILREKSHSQPI